jgi:glycerol-3-phosphate dehydrogenase
MLYPEFSHRTRAEAVARLKKNPKPEEYDALVVGGGIVGAGLARELAIRGVSCLLAEKGDFASGTSSRSSKLIHGGLRYLEMFDFHLVFEALAERHWLLKTHPHLVQPLEFNLPIYRSGERPPGARPTGILGAGLWVYDALSLFRTPFFHGKHSKDEFKHLFPGVREKGLKGSYYYADAMMLDDEVVLETVLDARRRGAEVLNYLKVNDISTRSKDGFYEAVLEDERGGGTARVRAREVIVCVGPWTEAFGNHVPGGAAKRLKPSKGVHLIFPWKRLPIEKCLVMYAGDGRIVFAIPRKDLGTGAELVIVGTTDSAEHGDLDTIHANRADVDYLMRVLGEYFPEARLTESDIAMTYAGVRPLLDTGEESEAKTSREHEIWKNESGVVFMAGGKYTTFRKISQELADFSFPATRAHGRAQNHESKALLSRPEDYESRMAGKPLWGRFTDEWLRWKIEHHAPCTLEDIVFRRFPLWMAGRGLTDELLDRVASVAAPAFGWDARAIVDEKARVREGLARGLAWV